MRRYFWHNLLHSDWYHHLGSDSYRYLCQNLTSRGIWARANGTMQGLFWPSLSKCSKVFGSYTTSCEKGGKNIQGIYYLCMWGQGVWLGDERGQSGKGAQYCQTLGGSWVLQVQRHTHPASWEWFPGHINAARRRAWVLREDERTEEDSMVHWLENVRRRGVFRGREFFLTTLW